MRKTYLVTGACGFIASHFIKSCKNKGIKVIGVDSEDKIPPYQSRPRHEQWEDSEYLFAEGHDEYFWGNIDAIVHLGACTDTLEHNYAYLQRVNIEFSKKLHQKAEEYNIPFIYASSAAVYGSLPPSDYAKTPTEALKPLNPYGESKRQFDLYHEQQIFQGCGLRFFNVYGTGEEHKGPMKSMVSNIMEKIVEKGKTQVSLFKARCEGYKDGEQLRDFVHVSDTVDVLHFVIDEQVIGIYDVGTGVSSTFNDIVTAVSDVHNKNVDIEYIDMPQTVEVAYQYETRANIAPLRELGYGKPFKSLKEGVAEMYENCKNPERE